MPYRSMSALVVATTLCISPSVFAKGAGGGSKGGHHSEINVTKSTNTASPKMMQKTGSAKKPKVKTNTDIFKNNGVKDESMDDKHPKE